MFSSLRRKTTTRPILGALFCLLLGWTFSGCDTGEEPIPAYLHVEPFEVVSTNFSLHGSVSHKITNARITLIDKETGDPHLVGTVALPGTVPVLVTGEVEAQVDPMIKANGSSLYLEIYPFYKRFTKALTLSPNQETTLKPFTEYVDNADFVFIEDFEHGINHLFEDDRDLNIYTRIEISSEDVFEGIYSGKIKLDTANSVIVAATNISYDFDPVTAGKTYMEVNYKTEVPLEFGVLAVDNQGVETPNFEFVVLPREEWNKIYFNLSDLLSTSGEKKFVFALRAGIPRENGQFTLNEAHIFLDNIKLIHF